MKILYQAWIAGWFEVDSQIWQIQKEIALNQLDVKREECIIEYFEQLLSIYFLLVQWNLHIQFLSYLKVFKSTLKLKFNSKNKQRLKIGLKWA